jgi:predicted O-methyltransferase YrrM
MAIVQRLKRLARKPALIGHKVALKVGLVVLPNHYYTPVADIEELRRTRNVWAHRSSMLGIDVDIEAQKNALRRTIKPFEPEYRGNANYLEGAAKGFGPGYGYVEAQCFHGMVRSLKPRRIIEVGSGISTYCALKALALNAKEGSPGRIHCVEPYPRGTFLLDAASRSEVQLTRSQVQTLDPAFFQDLEAGDLLFIDSSHALKPGGDVFFLYLEVLPRLKPGVYIHIHDIYFPYLYQRDLLQSMLQWSETALLQAVMTNNSRLAIVFCLSQLHYDAPEILGEVFPEYRQQPASDGLTDLTTPGHFPSSIYLRTA